MASIISRSPAETFEFARGLAAELRDGDVLALCGTLGAGKTQFVKGLVAGLGGDPAEVTSPTFTLINEYEGSRLPVFHFDFYRLETENELLAIGWDEYLAGGGVLVIEWADKFWRLLPDSARWFDFEASAEAVREIAEREP